LVSIYQRLQHRRVTFDEVAALSVEGVNKSPITRAKQIAWDTVDCWLEKAAEERSGWLVYLGVEPAMDPLRDHPRFQSLSRRVALPEQHSSQR